MPTRGLNADRLIGGSNMSETVNQVQTATAAQPETEPKTFTQEEMNAIVADRLGRERAKYADYDSLKEKAEKYDAAEEASKTELQKTAEKAAALQKQLDALTKANNIRTVREKVAEETGVPANLLFGEDEETCQAQAKAILEFKGPQTYPVVRDGGEVTRINTKNKPRDQFAKWFEQMSQ